jgi:uncharacterized protein (DUF736 family)
VTQYDNNLTGALFRNQKDGNEKRPDYRGQAEVDRKQYWVSAWIRTSKAGDKYMQLRFEAKTAEQHQGGAKNPPAQTAAARKEDFDDDIPF